MGLNAEQSLAAKHVGGPAVVKAVPGAGKTATMSARVAWLVRQGIKPERILCLTFSVDAANSMRSRVSKLLGIPEQNLNGTISTFHSQALRMLLQESKLQGNPVMEGRQVLMAIRRLFPHEDAVELRSEFGRMRRAMIRPKASTPEYYTWDGWLREQGMVDFDSMVYRAVELLEDNENIRSQYCNLFEHVIVDEAQDCDAAQSRFAILLVSKTSNLFAVGDPSQRIYGWRGATADLLALHHAKQYELVLNYRSTTEIVDAFRPYADESARDTAAKMRAARENNGAVSWNGFDCEEDQSEAVAKEIANIGLPATCAVLSRTRAGLSAIADALENRGISYIWNGRNFWAQKEVKSVLAFARLAFDRRDGVALRAALTSQAGCAKYLGAKFADEVIRAGWIGARMTAGKMGQERQWAEFQSVVENLSECRECSTETFIKLVINEAGFRLSDGEEYDSFADENLDALVRRSGRFSTIPALIEHARKMEHAKVKAGVVLSTIHGAKGLEWPNVFVVGVSEGILPHKRAEDLSEEQRCMYVALSRAQDRLWIGWHGKPSMFVPDAVCDSQAVGIRGEVERPDGALLFAPAGTARPNPQLISPNTDKLQSILASFPAERDRHMFVTAMAIVLAELVSPEAFGMVINETVRISKLWKEVSDVPHSLH